MHTLCLALALAQSAIAQQPAPAKEPMPKSSFTIKPDPRVEQRKYLFRETNEELSYVLYVSSKVSKDKKNPMIVALHGLGGDANFIVRERLVVRTRVKASRARLSESVAGLRMVS